MMFVRLLVIMPSIKLLHCMSTFLSYAQLARHPCNFESTRHCLPLVEYDIPPPIIINSTGARLLISLETSICHMAHECFMKEQMGNPINLNHAD